jgi:hypothetical protein
MHCTLIWHHCFLNHCILNHSQPIILAHLSRAACQLQPTCYPPDALVAPTAPTPTLPHSLPSCRYIFEEKNKKGPGSKKEAPQKVVQARLQELGPRFTLKLQSLQKGTFDSKHGEFEWVHKRKEMDTSRRKFHL